jgi:uncharacterized protein YhfF
MSAGGRSPVIEAFWLPFCRSYRVSPARWYDVFAFGDSAVMADELLALVLAGPKRATAALVLDFERSGDPLPERGAYSVILDGRCAPGCIIRTTAVEVRPFNQVDGRFAWDEGENDRTLYTWRAGHRHYFTRQCAVWNTAFDERMPVVLRRFEVVWPNRPQAG